MNRSLLIFLSTFAAAAPMKADVIFSSFVSGTTYPCCAGNGVVGNAATFQGNPVPPMQLASAFTPTVTHNLTEIDVAFWFPVSNDPDSNLFDISLNLDSAGAPGGAVETWPGLIAPTLPVGTSSTVESVFPLSAITLLAGERYWIVASPDQSNSWVVWNQNTFAGTGPGGLLAFNNGSGWVVGNSPSFNYAFQVLGNTPEPATAILLLPALLLLCHRCRHSA